MKLICANCGHTDREHNPDATCVRCDCTSLFLVVRPSPIQDDDLTECPSDVCGAPLAPEDIMDDGTCRYCGCTSVTLQEWLEGYRERMG